MSNPQQRYNILIKKQGNGYKSFRRTLKMAYRIGVFSFQKILDGNTPKMVCVGMALIAR